MKNKFIFLIIILSTLKNVAQLKDIKLIIPKENGYSYFDFVQFFPNQKHFAVCNNALSIYNTETAEIADEYDLNYGAKNLNISNDGNYILVTINNELLIFTFKNQKIELFFKTTTANLIEGLPNSQYYGSLPIGGCFFANTNNQIYISIGSFTLLYDIEKKVAINSFAFPLTDYILNSAFYTKKQEIILAKTTGTVNAIYKQQLGNLSNITEIIKSPSPFTKIRVRDSLALCFTSTNYFILNLETGKVVHEVEMMKTNYDFLDKATQAQTNKRPAISIPDKQNFSADEYIYDIDFLTGTSLAAYATNKGLKYIDLKTKKLVKQFKSQVLNIRFSNSGTRMIANTYSPYKALKVFEPMQMKLISEKQSMGNAITAADVSPNKQWMFTNAGTSGFIWDLRNFTKHVQIKDISGSDTSFIYGLSFLNDSELIVNSGKTFNQLNLSIYNIHKKKYSKIIKKNVYSFFSGFINDEFYYSDYNSLTIINLKTFAEEKYEGKFSYAASNPEQIINFTKQLVFIPQSTGYAIVNRKTKKTEYETKVWATNARVVISPDNKFVYTSAQIKKKQTISGNEIDMDVYAIVKIDMTKKQIVNDYAVSYFPYDFKIKQNTIGIWYLKQDYSGATEKETMYSEYNTEIGKETFTKVIAKTPEVISSHVTSQNGKYIALYNVLGNYFKVFNQLGDEVIDLSDLKLFAPKCFFVEENNRLIITSTLNALVTFVDLGAKKIIGQLANATNDNYFLVTTNLHYLGSKEFVKNIRFKYKSELFSFEQFDAYLNQPHKVLRAFGCSDSLLIKSYEIAYLKRMRLLGLKSDDEINFINLPTIRDIKIKEEKPGFVNFNIAANKGKNKLSKINIYNNGTLVLSEDINEDESAHFEKNITFETSSGINRFEFSIKDEKGLESPKISRIYNNTLEVKPNLYLVVIASEKFKNNKFDLSYALKDAGDVASTMANSKAFNKIEIKKLYNQSFAPDSIKNLKNFFSKATINDVVMIFFAGHGYLDDDFSYYFPTYYTDFTDPKINSVAYNSFETLFKNMKPTRKLMFIDACFSGEVDEDAGNEKDNSNKTNQDSTRSIRLAGSTFAQSTALEMSKAIFSDLRQNSGATIISSAGGTEAAFEGEKWNNGLFTYCLLNGMKSLKADLNNDKVITLSELQKFVAEEVNRLSEGKQTPTYRVENTILDYELW